MIVDYISWKNIINNNSVNISYIFYSTNKPDGYQIVAAIPTRNDIIISYLDNTVDITDFQTNFNGATLKNSFDFAITAAQLLLPSTNNSGKTPTYKILGQGLPLANILTNIYMVPLDKQVYIQSINICNTSNTDVANFRISFASNNAADSLKQYLYYDLQLSPLDTWTATMGISLNAGDVVRVYSSTGNLSFNLFGAEIS